MGAFWIAFSLLLTGHDCPRTAAHLGAVITALGVPTPLVSTIVQIPADRGAFFNALNNLVYLIGKKEAGLVVPGALAYADATPSPTLNIRYVQLAGFKRPNPGERFQRLSREVLESIRDLIPNWMHGFGNVTIDRASASYFDPSYPLVHTYHPTIELPLFPTVFNFNTSYLQHTLFVALPEAIWLKSHHHENLKMLVLGSGAGVDASLLARVTNLPVEAVDVNHLAVANTIATANTLDVGSLVRSHHSDGFDAVSEKYHLIVFNAPVPADANEIGRPNTMDPAGHLMTRIFSQLEQRLLPGGRLIIMSNRDLYRYIPNHFKVTEDHEFRDQMGNIFVVFRIMMEI